MKTEYGGLITDYRGRITPLKQDHVRINLGENESKFIRRSDPKSYPSWTPIDVF